MTRDEIALQRAEWDRQDCGCGLDDKCPDPPQHALPELRAAVQTFLDDWRKGDFDLPRLAALDAETMEGALTGNRIKQLYAENRFSIPELLAALTAMKRAFGDPMTRRALGGHNEEQQAAILAASAALMKASPEASQAQSGYGGEAGMRQAPAILSGEA